MLIMLHIPHTENVLVIKTTITKLLPNQSVLQLKVDILRKNKTLAKMFDRHKDSETNTNSEFVEVHSAYLSFQP